MDASIETIIILIDVVVNEPIGIANSWVHLPHLMLMALLHKDVIVFLRKLTAKVSSQ